MIKRIFLSFTFLVYLTLSISAVSASGTVEGVTVTSTRTHSGDAVLIHRLYNSGTGEHLYSGSGTELAALFRSNRWTDEGIAWYAPKTGDPVYRLHNKNTRKHFYTISSTELEYLTGTGSWEVDFNGRPAFYSGGTVPVYRAYNAREALHQYTASNTEYDTLEICGWTKEGTALKALSTSDTDIICITDPSVSQDTPIIITDPSESQGPTTDIKDPSESQDQTTTITDPSASQDTTTNYYVLNTHTNVFHDPNCEIAKRTISDHRKDLYLTEQEMIDKGYDPCSICLPGSTS